MDTNPFGSKRHHSTTLHFTFHSTMPAIIILAAGASTRLGKPKQLLPFQGKTLLQRTIDTALATDVEAVILILGAHAEKMLAETDTAGVEVCVNGSWREGMASSVRLGISTLQQSYPTMDSAIILLCDQPFVTADLIRQLMQAQQQSGKKIVASHYKNTAGVPVLFMRSLFPELMKLQGQEGAKKLLEIFQKEVVTVPFPEGKIDIDTAADYEQLMIEE